MKSINNICLSTDGRHVELWNNGNRILTCSVSLNGLHGAVADARNYIREWGADESPNIDRELQSKMDAADAALAKMAFAGEWR